jgi:CheY-like chemotaxis protein
MAKALGVLVAEDSHDLRQFMRVMLRTLGVEATLVEDGQQALDAAAKTLYDLIFLDIQMPVLNGYSTMQTLRKNGFSGLIYALTGLTREEGVDCPEGFDGFLVKPISRADLKEILAKAQSLV